jgi:uncharacterized protein
MSKDPSQLRKLLTETHQFPCDYQFKFVVPAQQKHQVLELAPQAFYSERLSKNGKYVSITLKVKVDSAQQVIDFYDAASKIENLIAL